MSCLLRCAHEVYCIAFQEWIIPFVVTRLFSTNTSAAPQSVSAAAPVVAAVPGLPRRILRTNAWRGRPVQGVSAKSQRTGRRGKRTQKPPPTSRARVVGTCADEAEGQGGGGAQERWCPDHSAVVLDRHDLIQEHVQMSRRDTHEVNHWRLAHQQGQHDVRPRKVECLAHPRISVGGRRPGTQSNAP